MKIMLLPTLKSSMTSVCILFSYLLLYYNDDFNKVEANNLRSNNQLSGITNRNYLYPSTQNNNVIRTIYRGGGDDDNQFINIENVEQVELPTENDFKDEQHETTFIENKTASDSDSWRALLPPALQQRKGTLHKITIYTRRYRGQQGDISRIEESTQSTSTSSCCELYLLGTAHVSKESCVDARLLMEYVRPDALFVELCTQRMGLLSHSHPQIIEDDNDTNQQQGQDQNQNQIINDKATTTINKNKKNKPKEKSIGQLTKDMLASHPGMTRTAALSSVLLTRIQEDYASKLGVNIGGEFQEAFMVAVQQQQDFLKYIQDERERRRLVQQHLFLHGPSTTISNELEYSEFHINRNNIAANNIERQINGCDVILGDRPVRLTLLRVWESLSFFGKIKLVLALIFSSFKQPTEDELREWMESVMNDPTNDIISKSIEDLSKHFPSIGQVIIKERDIFMTMKLLQTAKILTYSDNGGSKPTDSKIIRKIVAIVGAGHLPGIIKRLEYVQQNPEEWGEIENVLSSVVDTKKYKVDQNDDMKSLVKEVASINIDIQP